MPQTPEAPHPFDALHGTDTGGPGRGYAIPGFFSNTYANGYLGIAPSALTQAISQLPFDPRDFTFIDLGCGKGRAVMVATQFPFRQIIGVEISPELCATARTNIARNPVWAGRISILEQDASTYTFPETPLLIFLYHPFLPPLLRRVLANLERQLRQTSRETWVIYADNPGYRVLERFTFLREIAVPSYLLSAEDRSAVEDDPTHQSMTVYVADLSR
jgi:SAM-dependent methyltransferase